MNNNNEKYSAAPADFALCFEAGCASAEKCLRRLAALQVKAEREVLSAVNPRRTDAAGQGACPYFSSAEPVRMAYGFARAMRYVPHGEVNEVRAELCQLMCQRNYYYLRRGQKPIDPDMQAAIAAVLARHGVAQPVEFDRYEWQIAW